jgi:hypothetical protein
MAILCMILGLFGMSYYSTSATTTTIPIVEINTPYQEVITTPPYRDEFDDGDAVQDDVEEHDTDDNHQQQQFYENRDVEIHMQITHRSKKNTANNSITSTPDDNNCNDDDDDDEFVSPLHHNINNESDHTSRIMSASSTATTTINNPSSILHDHEMIQHVHVLGRKLSKRHVGIMSAVFCGVYGGSIMAPMKFSTADTKGTHYLLSFAIGALLVNVSFWIFRYFYNIVHYRSCYNAYEQLPSFHIRKMWLVGGTSGIIWSIGNFFSLISVFYLGEGVGYPLVQTSILISGLWGLFYFKEIQGTERITKWLLSSLITVFGILLLSYEHHSK